MSKASAWIRHPQTKAVVEVPETAVPIYAQSGWVQLDGQEVVDLYAKQRKQQRAAESAMSAASKKPTTSSQKPPPPADDSEQPKSGSTSKENS